MSTSFRIVSIAYSEPTFLASLVIAGLVCLMAGRYFARIVSSSSRAARFSAWLLVPVVAVAAWVLPVLLVQPLYGLVHGGGNFVCTYFVGRPLGFPLVTGVIAFAHRRLQLRQQKVG